MVVKLQRGSCSSATLSPDRDGAAVGSRARTKYWPRQATVRCVFVRRGDARAREGVADALVMHRVPKCMELITASFPPLLRVRCAQGIGRTPSGNVEVSVRAIFSARDLTPRSRPIEGRGHRLFTRDKFRSWVGAAGVPARASMCLMTLPQLDPARRALWCDGASPLARVQFSERGATSGLAVL